MVTPMRRARSSRRPPLRCVGSIEPFAQTSCSDNADGYRVVLPIRALARHSGWGPTRQNSELFYAEGADPESMAPQPYREKWNLGRNCAPSFALTRLGMTVRGLPRIGFQSQIGRA